jgi:hypothetical protein
MLSLKHRVCCGYVVTRVAPGAVYVDAGCEAVDAVDGVVPVTKRGNSAVVISTDAALKPWPVRAFHRTPYYLCASSPRACMHRAR